LYTASARRRPPAHRTIGSLSWTPSERAAPVAAIVMEESMADSETSIALIGYGEVGTIFGRALVGTGARVAAYDILVADPARSAVLAGRARSDGVRLASSAADAVTGADLVIIAVTASETRAAAESIVGDLARGAVCLDIDSASPATKIACGERIDAAGGRYVEAAVMTSVPPYGLAVPMLLGGRHAADALPRLRALGFDASVASATLGVASATKMCRSIVIKGMESLFVESLLCARLHGVEDQVLASLVETFPGIDWDKQASYFWSRVVQHGKRRAEEMREAAAMVREDGFEPLMAGATAGRQAFVAALAARGIFRQVPDADGWRALADRAIEEATTSAD
jgi:3-hydroxyisobutyrate dehydrogenase-like beta-hydroxyacid dehydrogenase